ncbi:uncharacterized protein Dsimw501_GD13510 [Drosophila simulans]|uniref:Uncharacterized protein n=1 Tax=Drosophila simulans TaxID=7240 RepID=A0A0J9RLR4_DROSI|nr:uncharacterized protein Dsimw501_GD13510 [Drosophila simulans]
MSYKDFKSIRTCQTSDPAAKAHQFLPTELHLHVAEAAGQMMSIPLAPSSAPEIRN